MNWKEKLKNLLSRKFLLALIGAASGLAIALGADSDFVQILVGAATALASVVSYIVMKARSTPRLSHLRASLYSRLL